MTTPVAGPEHTVLERVKLDEFVQFLIERHAPPSTLLVCGTQGDFVQQLIQATQRTTNSSHRTDAPPHPLLTKTLRLLGQSRTLQVAFCPSLDAARAFLGTYSAADHADGSAAASDAARRPMLAALDLASAHRETSSWSAQGLGRTLALAVDAAHRAGVGLVLADCATSGHGGDGGVDGQGRGEEHDEGGGDGGGAQMPPGDARAERPSVWDEQVAILNVTTKSFGAGDRGWVGRTVSVRKVAERWFVFDRWESDPGAA